MDAELQTLVRATARIIGSHDPQAYLLMSEALRSAENGFLRMRFGDLRGTRFRADSVEAQLVVREILHEVRRTAPSVYEELQAIADAFAEDEAARAVAGGQTRAAAPPPPSARATTNSVLDGAFHAPVVQAGTVSGGVNTYYAQPAHPSLPQITEWPRLDVADPVACGVRSTRRLHGEPGLPRYVERDCDRELDARVAEAARSGGLVVVTGAPLSGKTRTGWAALATNLPGTTRVFAPSAGTDLRGLPALLRGRGEQSCVLWLDDLGSHLGEQGLTPALLADLVRLRVPVVATMEDEVYDARRFGTSDRARVLEGIRPVELNRVWSDGELRRLADRTEDARLRSAGLWRGAHTVPEFLTVGPDLVEEWRRAGRRGRHPRGHLLVRAAVDLTLCGVPDGQVSAEVLRRAQRLYPEAFASAEAEPFEAGLAWAAEMRYGVSGLLVPGEKEETWGVFGALLADAVDRPDRPPVPLAVWMFALTTVESNGARSAIRSNAHVHLVDRAGNDPQAAAVLARINGTVGDLETAEYWYRKAADAGHTEAAAGAGELMMTRDAEAEAVPYLEMAAEAGIVRSQYYLGMLLADRAQSWLTRAAEAGHPLAARALPALRTVTGTPPDTVEE
ncbi:MULTISPECIES: tetratricopeptide repeat protein [unclassified Streptomyces]|uniref:tetratricopeptide repeat protein n=1 Tax=unclassified Streptomyces TaxID=2593676 RepID=UPI0034504441